MASYTGVLPPPIFDSIGSLRPEFFEEPFPFGPSDAWLASTSNTGTRTNTQPVTENPQNYAGFGEFAAGYGGIFYNRVQIQPSLIDLGNLLTEQSRYVSVWNGFLSAKEIESIAAANAEGVNINVPVPVPSTLGPLQEVIYTVTGTTQGPSRIDATFTWTIDGEEYDLRILGNRIVVFPFLADWKDGLTEELAWMSSVERAYDGGEQRRELRNAARKKFNYAIKFLDRHQTARFENILFGWQARNYAVPIPSSRTRLESNVGIGASALSMNTVDRGFYAGQPAVIMTGPDKFEAVEIDTVTDTGITLARPIVQNWLKGSYVFAAGAAHLQQQQPLNRVSSHYGTAQLDWDFEVTDANANTPSGAAAVVYRSQEVYLAKPSRKPNPSFTFQDMFDVFGADDVGELDFEPTSDWPTIIRQHLYIYKTRAEIMAFRRFLKRRAGRVVPVWLPSWNDDFIIAANVDSSSSAIVVRDNGYRSFVNGHEARRDIAIFRYGVALPIMLRITDVADNFDGTVNLIFDSTVGTTFTKEAVKQICHMNLFRLGSDSVTLQWHTDTAMSATLNFIMVKA